MAFRFDMQSKTPQQRIIVSKRDPEDKRRKQEAEKNTLTTVDSFALSSDIDKNTSPFHGF